jgi:hypothetical protein
VAEEDPFMVRVIFMHSIPWTEQSALRTGVVPVRETVFPPFFTSPLRVVTVIPQVPAVAADSQVTATLPSSWREKQVMLFVAPPSVRLKV